ncbi:MAG: energy transducer TonB [Candidatus Acidiferrales bacterium]
MGQAELVCKGHVRRVAWDVELGERAEGVGPSRSALGYVVAKRCYKGEPKSNILLVEIPDNVQGPTLPVNEPVLVFLKAAGERYRFAAGHESALPAPGILAPTVAAGEASLQQLEADLKLALQSSDREETISALRLFGGMRRMGSTSELNNLLPTKDRAVEGLVHLALLRLGDHSRLREAAAYVGPSMSEDVREPGVYGVYTIQEKILLVIRGIRDPAAQPILREVSQSANARLRESAQGALMAMESGIFRWPSSRYREAKLVHKVEPQQPPIAQAANLDGAVHLDVVVGKDGRVQSVRVVSGHPLLVQAAVEAVRQWRYEPAQLNGEPVEQELRMTVVVNPQ